MAKKPKPYKPKYVPAKVEEKIPSCPRCGIKLEPTVTRVFCTIPACPSGLGALRC